MINLYSVMYMYYVIQVLGQFLEEALKMLETIKEGLVHIIINNYNFTAVHLCIEVPICFPCIQLSLLPHSSELRSPEASSRHTAETGLL